MTAAVNALHVFIIVPLLLWIYSRRGGLPENFCKVCLLIVAFAAGYHLYMLKNLTEKTMWKNWIYLLHILLVFPILAWVLYQCNKASRKWYEMILLLAFSALGYHVYNWTKYS
jgi:hypothetical protein